MRLPGSSGPLWHSVLRVSSRDRALSSDPWWKSIQQLTSCDLHAGCRNEHSYAIQREEVREDDTPPKLYESCVVQTRKKYSQSLIILLQGTCLSLEKSPALFRMSHSLRTFSSVPSPVADAVRTAAEGAVSCGLSSTGGGSLDPSKEFSRLNVEDSSGDSVQVYQQQLLLRDEGLMRQELAGFLCEVEEEELEGALETLQLHFPAKELTDNVRTTVKLLLSLGGEISMILKLFERLPAIWRYDTEGRIQLPLLIMRAHGVSFKAGVQIIIRRPLILKVAPQQMEAVLHSFTNELKVKRLVRILMSAGQVLGLSMTNLEEKIAELHKAGVTDIGAAVDKWPNLLNHGCSAIRFKMEGLRKMLQVENVAPLITRLPHLLGMSTDTVKESFEGLVAEFGVTATREMIISQPGLLTRSWATLQPKIKFIKSNLENGHSSIQKWPTGLTYSLEDRIQPRILHLKEAGLEGHFGLNVVLSMSKDQFAGRCLELAGPSTRRRRKSAKAKEAP